MGYISSGKKKNSFENQFYANLIEEIFYSFRYDQTKYSYHILSEFMFESRSLQEKFVYTIIVNNKIFIFVVFRHAPKLNKGI